MKRPVWLFSLDTEQFHAPPMTTGGLKAYFLANGASAAATDVELVHFRYEADVSRWVDVDWPALHLTRARQAVVRGLTPVLGFSVYTWNAAAFLSAMRQLRASCPGVCIVAGGPHVQRAEDYLHDEDVDVVVLGEGEQTFQQWLDCSSRDQWAAVQGLAYVEPEGVVETERRERFTDLDTLPSALDVLDLRDAEGKPRYESVAYETSRGCPFRCAFCEWGTGAIGTKMYQFSLGRIRADFERLVEGGIENLWLADSNFGALREDLDKARAVVDLRRITGRPSTFATSWSKTHNERVQQIVTLLHENDLLTHYNLALQTLTPLALQLSNRKNMRSNRYEPIAKAMAEQGIQIATELIWGLPGDNLADFERNLDRLIGVFPNINIFGYTLLPGTEFYDRRADYEIQTVPVAGYGKAKGEYVIGCHTFDSDEGMEGYFLITAYILLIRGYVMPLTARYLALLGEVPVSPLLRSIMRALVDAFAGAVEGLAPEDRMDVYEHRADLYLAMLTDEARCFDVVRRAISSWLSDHAASASARARTLAVLDLDRALCPRVGPSCELRPQFAFDAVAVERALGRMDLPPAAAFDERATELVVRHPAHVGEILRDPDGGSWMRGRVVAAGAAAASVSASSEGSVSG